MDISKVYEFSSDHFEYSRILPGITDFCMSEAVERLQILAETYLGRKPVKKIQDAMDEIYKKSMADRNWVCRNTAEAKALDKAICDVFGFKSCTIYWRSSPDMGNGPFTIPVARYILSCDDAIGFQYGKNQSGFYDKNHVYSVVINMDQELFHSGGLTSEEMMAILLHELGHNFDLTPFAIVNAWYRVVYIIMYYASGILTGINIETMRPFSQSDRSKLIIGAGITAGLETLMATEEGRKAYLMYMNIDDMIMTAIPPLKYFDRLTGPAMDLISTVMNVTKFVTWPIVNTKGFMAFMAFLPVNYVLRTFLRKSETYADSFAATYGYGAELGQGLAKLDVVMAGSGLGDDIPIVSVFYDLNLLIQEFLSTVMGGHGSTSQRYKRMLDALDHDLETSNLLPKDKATIKRERDRINASYQAYVNATPEQRNFISIAYRKMLEGWFAGKNYIFSPIMGRDITYAQ